MGMKRLFRLKRNDVQVLLGVFAAILLVGVWILTIYELDNAQRIETESAERDARNFARALEEHTERTVESADQAVTFLRHRYDTLGNALDIAKDLQDGVILGDFYNLFTIVNEHGDVVLSSKPFQPTNLADREHIRVHMIENNGGLFISKPVLGRVSKKWSIQMTRRISYPDGSFKGVVVVSIDPMYFTRLYHDLDLGRHGLVSLVGEDGTIRARDAGDDSGQGQDISASPLFKAMRASDNGLVRVVSTIDGRERIFAYRKLTQYPLYVVVGIDVEERFALYHAMRMKGLLMAVIASIIILAFSASIIVLVSRLVASRTQAIAASRAKSRFLSNMSHELRTPLNGILGYSELLKDELGGEQGSYAQDIHDCGKRLQGLIDAVLELSALESGRIALSEGRENVHNMMNHALAVHAREAAHKGLALTLDIAADVPQEIVCDRRQVLRVLDSLLNNAVRFTDMGAVRLNVARAKSKLLFSVIDTGIGVPAEQQERIFDKFAQADESDTRPQEGAGLGLAIARRLVELMGGEISMQPAPGGGSVFAFTLPLHTN